MPSSRKVVLKLPSRPAGHRRQAVSDDDSSEGETERSSEIEQSLSDIEEDNDRDGEGEDDEEDDEDEDEEDEEEDEEDNEEEEDDVMEEDEENVEDIPDEIPSDLIDDEDSLEEEEESGWYDREQVNARRRNYRDPEDPFDPTAALDALERPNARKKKVLSVEEQRIKRAELARRRKNLSERRLEEEKQDTVDKLLKRRAAKTRKNGERDAESLQRVLPIHPAITSWRSGPNGFSLSMTHDRASLN